MNLLINQVLRVKTQQKTLALNAALKYRISVDVLLVYLRIVQNFKSGTTTDE